MLELAINVILFSGMALNKYMHPRNIYKERKPNFKELASKYEEFLKCVTFDDHGKVQIDFKVSV